MEREPGCKHILLKREGHWLPSKESMLDLRRKHYAQGTQACTQLCTHRVLILLAGGWERFSL
jgi:hypothetical protein